MDSNIQECGGCGALTTYERTSPDQPSEGEKCTGSCDRWLCPKCIDWNTMHNRDTEIPICFKCAAGE